MALRHLLASLSVLTLLTLLAGCSSQPTAEQAAEISGACNVDTIRGVLGQTANAKRIEQVQQQANANTLRVLAPGDVATMDYNPQRLNIDIDESEVIIRLSCG
ncbi:I78 family peptidase inhibitor [Pseudomonas sp.]|jgi:hypothetical protein|uniref:I78 family peptidase inhibitor n=1 Tax=Pseudomonas sp. TaxID=306 RepID=UPI0037CC81F2